MKVLYLPLIRTSASYTVIYGRRWTVLEHLLLAALSFRRYTSAELATQTNMPSRLVVEALINLLRMSWIEVRSTEAGTFFSATAVGKANSVQSRLPEEELKDTRGTALCCDRIANSWFRAEDVDIVYEPDIPHGAHKLEPVFDTFDPNDAQIRNLLRFGIDERIEPSTLSFRTASRPFARIVVAFDKIVSGIPGNANYTLVQEILSEAAMIPDELTNDEAVSSTRDQEGLTEDVSSWNFVVGGPEHAALVREALERADGHIIIHSCFVSADTIDLLLPDFEKAAKRGVKIDLLWGLRSDPEGPTSPPPITDAVAILGKLSPMLRSRVQLSPVSSGSHAKVILYRDRRSREWISIVGSCNFLSTEFDWIDASYRSRNSGLALEILSFLLSSQLPSSGRWTPVARRLNTLWNEIPKMQGGPVGTHRIRLILDGEHYSAVTRARDLARSRLDVGCDIYGLAAETSVLVPAQSAAEIGCKVAVTYNRASKKLIEEGQRPDAESAASRGLDLRTNPILHAKYLLWDDGGVALSSFNWLATVVDGSRVNGAELGVVIEGPDVRKFVSSAFQQGGASLD